MRFSESWLRTFVNPKNDTESLAHAITMGNAEVKLLKPIIPSHKNIIIGIIVKISIHPNAKWLNIYHINIGNNKIINVINNNMHIHQVIQGTRVACALPGTQLVSSNISNNIEVDKLRLHGIYSEGFLCTASHLNLLDNSNKLLILPENAPIGKSVIKYLNLHDPIFEVKLTPNRADCLSIIGLARDVAAVTNTKFIEPIIESTVPTINEILPVKISVNNLCGRFSGRILRNINTKIMTPAWLISRLSSAGIKSISVIVDIINYVMLTTGHPSYIFDLNKIIGNIEIRWGRNGECFKINNNHSITISDKIGVITDQLNIHGIAGIIDNTSTISDSTNNIYIGVIFWLPDVIRGCARQFNLFTESSCRFEQGVDYLTTVKSLELITHLFIDICGCEIGQIDDQIINLPNRCPIILRISRLIKVLGIVITVHDISAILLKLQFIFKSYSDYFIIQPPSYRFDIAIEEDIIEEIARIYGYNNIPTNIPIAPIIIHPFPKEKLFFNKLRKKFVMLDYIETINFSFVKLDYEKDLTNNQKPLKILNPLNHLKVMRSSLLGSLIEVLRYNINHQTYRVRIFEIGRIFRKNTNDQSSSTLVHGISQPLRIGALVYGLVNHEQWGISKRMVDFFDLKGDLESLLVPHKLRFTELSNHPAFHPGQAASVWINGQKIGYIGQLHPYLQKKYQLLKKPFLFEIDFSLISNETLPKLSSISRFPIVQRDIAIIVQLLVTVQDILDTLWSTAKKLFEGQVIKDIILFDQYEIPDFSNYKKDLHQVKNKSLAFHIILQSENSSLTEKDIDFIITSLINSVTKKHNAHLRN